MNSFLTNTSEITFLNQIKDNLKRCDSFVFSVSFIKKAGLVLLYKELESAIQRGCKGKLITSTYQNFTDIESLQLFLNLANTYDNFECHLDDACFMSEAYETKGFHSKGYVFTYGEDVDIIVGSSNITRFALLKNIEWDLLMKDTIHGCLYQEVMHEFNYLWDKTNELTSDGIQKYARKLNYAIERWDMDYDVIQSEIKPNYMQKNALKELNRYRAMGVHRAMTVCSAGSGKTYLSAFDALNFNPDRLLYIVHESSILSKARETFQKVFGNQKTYGMYTGDSKEINADFVFATNITMANNLELFSKDTFDYIVIDECHHAVAESYQKIISYFEPEFMLGLTATPERLDNQDVFSLFDQNVPYELRLRDAIINDLVVPFHYYGIRDTLVDYDLSKKQEHQMLAQIVDTPHCKFICDEIEKHRIGGKLKALVFCRNQTHARMMAEAFQQQGYHATYLTGNNSVGERIRAYDDLQSDDKELEILCSVDILNEGVDIPGVNMVLFLRPTESSTVFIQQLGRGLRKYANKSFVTILDFIGNSYKRSVQIALALGSLSKNLVLEKRLMMDMVKDNFSCLDLYQYGVRIELDHESQNEIITYLENENFNSKQYLKQDYLNFKTYINCEFYPTHMDYLNNDCAPDIMKFMNIKYEGKKASCYYLFLKEMQESNLPVFSDEQITFLQYLSNLLPLVRPYEYQVVSLLMEKKMHVREMQNILSCDLEVFEHVIKFMIKEGALSKDEDGYCSLNVAFNPELKEHVNDLIAYGLTKYEAEQYQVNEPFITFNNYRMDQVQRKLLKDPKSNQKGTYIYGKTVVIFASLKKDASVEERKNYIDKFLSPSVFQWESMNHVSQKEYENLRDSEFAYVFVRKVTSENGMVLPFTYVGKGKLTNPRKQEKNQTYLFDIEMEEVLPDYLQYDFGLTRMN